MEFYWDTYGILWWWKKTRTLILPGSLTILTCFMPHCHFWSTYTSIWTILHKYVMNTTYLVHMFQCLSRQFLRASPASTWATGRTTWGIAGRKRCDTCFFRYQVEEFMGIPPIYGDLIDLVDGLWHCNTHITMRLKRWSHQNISF